jgi:hypothetical protein
MIVDTQKIDELPLAGKLELLEAISDALSRDVSKSESPTWHQKVLQEREHEGIIERLTHEDLEVS